MLHGLVALVLAPSAAAAPLESGEQLTWAVRWMGVEAGRATATLLRTAEGWSVAVQARNASWLDGLYPIDDRLSSAFQEPGGSTAYQTRFREGRFHEDAEMRLGPPAITVTRSREDGGQWVPSAATAPWAEGVEDPISAVYRLRVSPPGEEGPVHLSVFNGRRTLGVRAEADGNAVTEVGPARVVRVASEREGDWEGRLTLYLGVDADAVPLQAVLQTRAGPVTLLLVERTDPTP